MKFHYNSSVEEYYINIPDLKASYKFKLTEIGCD